MLEMVLLEGHVMYAVAPSAAVPHTVVVSALREREALVEPEAAAEVDAVTLALADAL
jgi:hypothetical protein